MREYSFYLIILIPFLTGCVYGYCLRKPEVLIKTIRIEVPMNDRCVPGEESYLT